MTPLLRFNQFATVAYGIQRNLLLTRLTVYHKKDITQEQPDRRDT